MGCLSSPPLGSHGFFESGVAQGLREDLRQARSPDLPCEVHFFSEKGAKRWGPQSREPQEYSRNVKRNVRSQVDTFLSSSYNILLSGPRSIPSMGPLPTFLLSGFGSELKVEPWTLQGDVGEVQPYFRVCAYTYVYMYVYIYIMYTYMCMQIWTWTIW